MCLPPLIDRFKKIKKAERAQLSLSSSSIEPVTVASTLSLLARGFLLPDLDPPSPDLDPPSPDLDPPPSEKEPAASRLPPARQLQICKGGREGRVREMKSGREREMGRVVPTSTVIAGRPSLPSPRATKRHQSPDPTTPGPADPRHCGRPAPRRPHATARHAPPDPAALCHHTARAVRPHGPTPPRPPCAVWPRA
jgi:hypothetical protein